MTAAQLLLDASGLIALARLDPLRSTAARIGPIAVTQEVWDEATPEGLPGADAVISARRDGVIEVLPSRSWPPIAGLGAGETATIRWAEGGAYLAVIDDRDARRAARRLAVPLTGTIALLVRLARSGHVGPMAAVLDRLDAMGFRVAPWVRAWAIEASTARPDPPAPAPPGRRRAPP